MFKLGQLLLPKAIKPNNDKNLLGDHKSIFVIDNQEEDWDLSVLIQNTHGPMLRVSMPTQH